MNNMQNILNEVYLWIIAAAPAITAVAAIICSVIKMINNAKHSNKVLTDKFEQLETTVKDTSKLDALVLENQVLKQENREIKKLLKQVLTELTKVQQPEEE